MAETPKELWWCPECEHTRTHPKDHWDVLTGKDCPGNSHEVRFILAEPVVAWRTTRKDGHAVIVTNPAAADIAKSRGWLVERLVSAGVETGTEAAQRRERLDPFVRLVEEKEGG